MGKIVGDIVFYATLLLCVAFLIYVAIMLAYNLFQLFFSKMPTQEGIFIQYRARKNAERNNFKIDF